MHKNHTLKEVLPEDEHHHLTSAALNLTGEDLEKIAQSHKSVSDADRDALTKLAVHRIKKGKNVFPYDDLNFGEYKEGDPQW